MLLFYFVRAILRKLSTEKTAFELEDKQAICMYFIIDLVNKFISILSFLTITFWINLLLTLLAADITSLTWSAKVLGADALHGTLFFLTRTFALVMTLQSQTFKILSLAIVCIKISSVFLMRSIILGFVLM